MMPRSFSAILDECLAALKQGESLESCLERYPDRAEELRTYLLLARRLTATPRHPPRPGVQAIAWQRFKSRAQDMRLGRRPPFSFNLGGLAWAKPLAIAAVVVFAIMAAGGGTIYASQDALPSSPLYTVKLASQDMRLWIVFDDTREAEILLDQSDQRTEEIIELLRRGETIPGNVLNDLRKRNARAVRILEDKPDELALLGRAREQAAIQETLLLDLWGDISDSAREDYAKTVATLHNARLRTAGIPGHVTPDDLAAGVMNITGGAEQLEEDLWVFGGMQVRLDSRSLGATSLEPGQSVQVIAARGADGSLLALNINITDRGQPDPRYLVSGAIDDIGEGEVVVGGQRIAVTESTLLKLRLLRGQQVEIRVEDVDGQAVASSIEGTGPEEATPALLAYEGVIEDDISVQGPTSEWTVSGQSFLVTPETELDAQVGALVRGARARVEAIVKDGQLTARRVTVLSADEESESVRVEGFFQGGDENTWTVSGVEVRAPADADLPEVGSLVTVEARHDGERLRGEKLLARAIADRQGFVLLRGHINNINEDGSWRVGLTPVEVGEQTVVLGEPEEGSRVFIWASRGEDGSLRAVYASVLYRRGLGQDAGSRN